MVSARAGTTAHGFPIRPRLRVLSSCARRPPRRAPPYRIDRVVDDLLSALPRQMRLGGPRRLCHWRDESERFLGLSPSPLVAPILRYPSIVTLRSNLAHLVVS